MQKSDIKVGCTRPCVDCSIFSSISWRRYHSRWSIPSTWPVAYVDRLTLFP